jgi:hypothetical protein
VLAAEYQEQARMLSDLPKPNWRGCYVIFHFKPLDYFGHIQAHVIVWMVGYEPCCYMIGRVRAMLWLAEYEPSYNMNGRVWAHGYCFGHVRAHDMDYVVEWSGVDAMWPSTLFGVDAKWSSTLFSNPWEAMVELYGNLR